MIIGSHKALNETSVQSYFVTLVKITFTRVIISRSYTSGINHKAHSLTQTQILTHTLTHSHKHKYSLTLSLTHTQTHEHRVMHNKKA